MPVFEPKIKFEFEEFIREKYKIELDLPENGARRGICRYFLRGQCDKGINCELSHEIADKTVVCKHWLRGLCKKGDACEFLHEYNLRKMPECFFYKTYKECSNPECLYLHIDPSEKVNECMWFATGFCRHGPDCKNRHVRLRACQSYITGFCPLGANCEFAHPRFENYINLLRGEN